jgi:pimeloyl-ACP methyl ester carboxylesterase
MFARRGRRPRLASVDRRVGVVAVVVASAAGAFALTSAMPRGPATAGQALTAMAVALMIGFAAGLVLRSRWAMFLAPPAFAAVFELTWLRIDGPTVDGLRFDGGYGILALILGRGFFGVVAFLPMVLAIALGAALARRRRGVEPARRGFRRRAGLYSRRFVTALCALCVLALAFFITRPGTTPAITGPDGEVIAGSIASLEKVELGGGEQWISIRGYSVDNPVLLYLHGGPGQSGLPFTRFLFADIARDFVVVDWDQRGNGKSFPALEPTATHTLDRIVDDTAELAVYLRSRFGERKIYLAGTSWGTTLGVLTVERHPDLFHAFIGGGQMVSQRETDLRIYRGLMEHATRTGDHELTARLRSFGEPPYADVFANAYVMQQYEALEPDYTLLPEVEKLGEDHFREIGPWGVFGREYDLVEKVNVMRGLMETFARVYPQLQEIDFRRDVKRLEVPVYLLRGTSELAARDDLAVEWFNQLEAPRKRMYALDHAGHAVLTERAGALRTILTETVLPETYEVVR